MKIGTRITLVTTPLVGLILTTYGYLALRSQRVSRTVEIQKQAEEIAVGLRMTVESGKFDDFLQAGLYDLFDDARWHVELMDVGEVPPRPRVDPGGASLERLRRVVTLGQSIGETGLIGDGQQAVVYMTPVRDLADPERRIVGAIEVARPMRLIDQEMAGVRNNIIISLILLVVGISLAISLLARRSISNPIDKLIGGIDEVAKGDLSRVVLQERDDEVGALAVRFNEMTRSLREAQEETRRGIEAKLALEGQLRHSEKLATIGQIAAEIAHEVGTPLNVVSGRARTMAKKAHDPDGVRKDANIIAEQAGRITRIIQRLLDFARQQVGTPDPVPVDINALARDTLEFLEHQLERARIRTRLDLDRDLDSVPGRKDELQQVLLNLYMNAIQAMEQGGTLEVATLRIKRRRPGLELDPEKDYAVISVTDSGAGISEADKDKIFEPFYTSRASAGGTGLGLAVALGIVKEHDGWIDIENRGASSAGGAGGASGHGTVFRVFLPLGDAQLISHPPEKRSVG